MKKLFALLLALTMLLSRAACGKTQEAPKTEGMASITVTVVHGDGTTKDFTYETDEEFLGPLLEAEGLIEGN